MLDIATIGFPHICVAYDGEFLPLKKSSPR